MRYIWKLEKHVDDVRNISSESCPRRVQTVFIAPPLDFKRSKNYDQKEALRRWAYHFDQRGFDFFQIAYANEYSGHWLMEDNVNLRPQSSLHPVLQGHWAERKSQPGLQDHIIYKSAPPIEKLRMRLRHQGGLDERIEYKPGHIIPLGIQTTLDGYQPSSLHIWAVVAPVPQESCWAHKNLARCIRPTFVVSW